MRMRWARYSATLALVAALAMPSGHARGHPLAFFPGQAFCPPRTLTVGTVIMPPQQCFSLFVMRTTEGTFLSFVPAGLFLVPFAQSIGVRTALGARIRARTVLLLPIALPVFFVPVDTMRLESFQVEESGGQLGIRLAEDPQTLVPLTQPSSYGSPGVSGDPSRLPVPSDVHIDPPGQDIPRDEAAFSGRWTGQWRREGQSMMEEGLPHFLVVEQIVRDLRFLRNERRVVAVFGWGRASDWNVFPGWLRAEGVFQRGILLLTLSNGAQASYRMSIDGTLDATYESPDFGTMRAVLSRTK